MNQVTLIGRLTKDPELKYTQGGKAFCKFSIAVTREFNRDEAGLFLVSALALRHFLRQY